jgi:hypothetical protein
MGHFEPAGGIRSALDALGGRLLYFPELLPKRLAIYTENLCREGLIAVHT